MEKAEDKSFRFFSVFSSIELYGMSILILKKTKKSFFERMRMIINR